MHKKPLMHFAHANGFVSGSYTQMFAPLETHYTLGKIEIIGHNPRYPVTQNWTNLIEEVRESVETFQQQHNTQEPVIGLGHSLGAALTLMTALKYPHLFSQLVLMEPPLSVGYHAFVWRLAILFGLNDKISPAGASKNRRVTFASREQVKFAFSKNAFFQSFDERCLDDYIHYGFTDNADGSCQLRFNREIEVQIFRTVPTNTRKIAKLSRKIKMPVHVIIGKSSDLTQRGILPNLIKHTQFNHSEFEGGHMFPLQKPEATAELIHGLVSTA